MANVDMKEKAVVEKSAAEIPVSVDTAREQREECRLSKPEKLAFIQLSLITKKTKYNKYSGFLYRTVSGILQGLKPVLAEVRAYIILNDEVCMVGNRFYVKSVATLYDEDDGAALASSTGWAREPENEKKKSESQVTGGASTYARKIALCGLLAIDDGVEDDTQVVSDPDNGDHRESASYKDKLALRLKDSGFPGECANSLVAAMTDGAFQRWSELPEEACKYILDGDWGMYCQKMADALSNEADGRAENGKN